MGRGRMQAWECLGVPGTGKSEGLVGGDAIERKKSDILLEG